MFLFQDKPFNITVIQVYAPTTNAEEAEVDQFYEDLQDLFRSNTKKRYPFHHRGLDAKVRSQEVPGVIGNNNTRDNFTHGHHQMVSTKIRLIIFFAAEDGGVLYSSKNNTWS